MEIRKHTKAYLERESTKVYSYICTKNKLHGIDEGELEKINQLVLNAYTLGRLHGERPTSESIAPSVLVYKHFTKYIPDLTQTSEEISITKPYNKEETK